MAQLAKRNHPARLQLFHPRKGQPSFPIVQWAKALITRTALVPNDLSRHHLSASAPRATSFQPILIADRLIHWNCRDSSFREFWLFHKPAFYFVIISIIR